MYEFLTYIFLFITPYLGHPNWEYRELATDILSYSLPFSYKALELNLTNPDHETYKRTLFILNGRWYGRLLFDYKTYSLAYELIYTDYKEERYELPWLPDDQMKLIHNDLNVIKAIRFIRFELLGEETSYYEEYSGIDEIRFFVRGLKAPYAGLYEENIKLWKETKDNWRKK